MHSSFPFQCLMPSRCIRLQLLSAPHNIAMKNYNQTYLDVTRLREAAAWAAGFLSSMLPKMGWKWVQPVPWFFFPLFLLRFVPFQDSCYSLHLQVKMSERNTVSYHLSVEKGSTLSSLNHLLIYRAVWLFNPKMAPINMDNCRLYITGS